MEEGCQKCKRLSYTAKFKREVVCYTENRNHKAAAIFGVDESNTPLWQIHKAAICECKASQKIFTGSKKGRFPEICVEVFTFFFQEKCKTGINCIVLFLWHIKWLYHFSKFQFLTANLIHTRFLSALDFLALLKL
jgi:hypothetical protein